MKKILLGIVIGVAVCAVVPLMILASGRVNMGADHTPGWLERTLAPWALDRSVDVHAPQGTNPRASDAAAVAIGLGHYKENCVMCHGAQDIPPGELAQGLNPSAPPLDTSDTADTPDGQLFWFAKHGVRMTGMPAFGPTHTDEELWDIIAAVRHLPQLTPQEKARLAAPAEASESHPAAEGQSAPAAGGPPG